MAIRNAVERNLGTALIELMIAALVGLMALTMLGHVFLLMVRNVGQRTQEILLLQTVANAMQVMKEEMYPAGYDGLNQSPVRLSAAANIIHSQNTPPLVGFVYRIPSGRSAFYYRHIVYRQEMTATGDGQLLRCEKSGPERLTVAVAAASTQRQHCYSLFDPEWISVTNFSVQNEELVGGQATGALIRVSVTAVLTEHPGVTQSFSFQIQQRNWQ